MAEALRVVLPDLAPRYIRLLLPLWYFFAFLTGVKFLPGIKNNFGPFEICGLIVIFAYFAVERRVRHERHHPLITIVMAMLVLAAATQFKIPSHRALYGAVQVGILAFLLLFLLVMRHYVERYHLSPEKLLTIVTFSVLIVGPWVYLDGMASGGDIEAAGPFRNRAHMASYMLTAFWLTAAFLQWPQLRPRLRLAGYAAGLMALYAIAVSGRRSVYLALFVGLLLWAVAFVATHAKRVRFIMTAVLLVASLAGLYLYGEALGPRGSFFKQRVGLIDDRLRSISGNEDNPVMQSFYQLQLEGVARAFRDAPLLGIGWGGFPESAYSPTGHEVHSTPLRFLAELGLAGFALYLALIGYLLATAARLLLKMRRTPYGSVYLVLAIASASMTVSNIYNRHITERTFWIYLAVFLALEYFAADWHRLRAMLGEDSVANVRSKGPAHDPVPAVVPIRT